jgi:uncharacterized protein YjhX (UPF0386 family)
MKLTARMFETLASLSCCTRPWDAQARSNIAMLRKLEQVGAAELRAGQGWVITEAGRIALSSDGAR